MNKTQLYHSGVYDERIVNDLLALGDMEFIRELIAIFKENTPNYLEELVQFYQERDAYGMRQVLHKMRGTCGTVGAKSMLASVDALRKALVDIDWPETTFRLNEMKEVWSGTYPYLNLVFNLEDH